MKPLPADWNDYIHENGHARRLRQRRERLRERAALGKIVYDWRVMGL